MCYCNESQTLMISVTKGNNQVALETGPSSSLPVWPLHSWILPDGPEPGVLIWYSEPGPSSSFFICSGGSCSGNVVHCEMCSRNRQQVRWAETKQVSARTDDLLVSDWNFGVSAYLHQHSHRHWSHSSWDRCDKCCFLIGWSIVDISNYPFTARCCLVW